MLQRTSGAVGLVVAVLCAACTSTSIRLYEGRDRAPAEVATITLPEQLEVASVNGVEIEGASGLLSKGDKTLKVVPGRYDVLAYYRELWERADEHDVLRSDPALFVVQAEAGHRYRIDYERPQRFEEAKSLSADFEGWVEDLATGERTASQDSSLSFRKGFVAAFTLDDTLVPSAGGDGRVQTVEPLSPTGEPQGGKPAAAPGADPPGTSAVPPMAEESGVPAAPAKPASRDPEWLNLMKGLWSESSAEERREFLRWVGEQR